MKSIVLFILTCLAYVNLCAQTTTTAAATYSGTLLPDQNPNYQRSRDKYINESTTLTKNEGVTIQETYKAIDDVQAKKERKELASNRRHERRMGRIQSRGYRRQSNNIYYDNNYYNNGYYSNPNGFYSPQYYSNRIFSDGNSILNTTLLGLAVWSLFNH